MAPANDASDPRDPASPRVCAVVVMNHPFPALLPLLRRIYAGRFSAVRFLIPFEQMPDDPDVITVYRGSYTHSGYINDARRELAEVDCDYFLVLHDDVLLHPRISERTFRSVFPLGPDDGFIYQINELPYSAGDWIWYYSLVPKLLYPKSPLVGTGIEAANLTKYLPDADALQAKMEAAGIFPRRHVKMSNHVMADVRQNATQALLQGLHGTVHTDHPDQKDIDRRGADITDRMSRLMLDFEKLHRPERVDVGQDQVTLPLPLVTAGSGADFFILPRSRLAAFAHAIGVASAANLFVEIVTPVMLLHACDRVETCATLGLDRTGFEQPHKLAWFIDTRRFAIHPYKLSRIVREGHEESFLDQLHAIAEGTESAAEHVSAKYFNTLASAGYPGWHTTEEWGCWSLEPEVIAPVLMSAPGAVQLGLVAPLGPALPAMTVTVAPPGGAERTVRIDREGQPVDVLLDAVHPDADGIARIRLTVDRCVSPWEHDAANGDRRPLGVGLCYIRAA